MVDTWFVLHSVLINRADVSGAASWPLLVAMEGTQECEKRGTARVTVSVDQQTRHTLHTEPDQNFH